MITRLSALSIVISFLVALASLSFAHRSSAFTLDTELEAFLLSGGTLAALCGDLEDPDNPRVKDCSACRLIMAVALPDNLVQPRQTQLPRALKLRHMAQLRHHAAPRDPTQQTWAPPQA